MHSSDTIRALLITALAVTIFATGACEGGQAPSSDAPADTEEVPVEDAEDSVQTAADEGEETDATQILEEGLVTYTAGDVEDRLEEESWRYTDIGLEFGFDHAFRTGGSGTAELQFGESLIIHLDESTDMRVAELSGSGETDETVLDVAGGTLRGRLDNLARDETLRVRTESAVVGVRGTAFEVSHDRETGSSSVGVSTGEVVVSPRAVDEARMLVTTISDQETGALLEEIIDEVETTVRADEQILLSASQLDEVGRQLEALLEVAPSVDDESLDEQERGEAR
ncbi:MAG: FecR domain-containing protein, partial [Spirochaetales bacterium]